MLLQATFFLIFGPIGLKFRIWIHFGIGCTQKKIQLNWPKNKEKSCPQSHSFWKNNFLKFVFSCTLLESHIFQISAQSEEVKKSWFFSLRFDLNSYKEYMGALRYHMQNFSLISQKMAILHIYLYEQRYKNRPFWKKNKRYLLFKRKAL